MGLARGDVAALPYADATFDRIFSIHTFYFWPDRTRIIADLIRLLRPGGRCVITLSTGRVQPSGARVYGALHAELEEQVLPELLRAGFGAATLEHGPDSRDYTSVGVIAEV
jgi:ubiquinone/menaquinone biosynthesis C-methylase UbiE